MRDTLDNNNKILESLEEMLTKNYPRMQSVYQGIKPFAGFLNPFTKDLGSKYLEIFADTERSGFKRGPIIALGDVWKYSSRSQSAKDGEFYSKCIEKLNKDEHELQNLIKNQIFIATSVTKNFNTTTQNIQIDKKTFNSDLKMTESSVLDIDDNLAFFQAQLEIL